MDRPCSFVGVLRAGTPRVACLYPVWINLPFGLPLGCPMDEGSDSSKKSGRALALFESTPFLTYPNIQALLFGLLTREASRTFETGAYRCTRGIAYLQLMRSRLDMIVALGQSGQTSSYCPQRRPLSKLSRLTRSTVQVIVQLCR